MIGRASILLLAFAASLMAPASAQVPPFFAGSPAAIFDPEISVVDSGVVNDVQATVSPDRKYVTLNMRSTNTSLLALREFMFQSQGPALGFVGGAAAANRAGSNPQLNVDGRRRADEADSNRPRASASSIRRQAIKPQPASRTTDVPKLAIAPPTLLDRPGMTRVDDRRAR